MAIHDLSQLDPAKVLLDFGVHQALYDTGPFDDPGKHLRFYPGGFSIWSGFPGAGKTTLIRETIAKFLKAGKGVFLASFEETRDEILVRLCASAAGVEYPTSQQMQAFHETLARGLSLWKSDEESTVTHLRLIEQIRNLATFDGLSHAFIDSLMGLDVRNDDFEQQRQAANAFAQLARTSKCHIHLVAHPRKLVSSNQEPDINDVAGAREIAGLADNVLFVRKLVSNESYRPGADCTPMQVSIRKQRHFDGSLGDVTGWFHRKQKQFHVEQFAAPTRYLPDWAYD